MARQFDKENDKSRERLKKLLDSITDEELKLIIYKEGWTIATALGHLGFWDERRLALVKYWEQSGVKPSDINGLDLQTVNDALVPLFLAIPVRKVAGLALTAAEKLDREIAGLSDGLVKKIEALGDEFALNRGLHRKMHLDEIYALLKSRRGGK